MWRFILIFILIRSATGEFLIEINSGIYQEEIGKVAVINQEAEVWVKMNLEGLETDFKIVEEL